MDTVSFVRNLMVFSFTLLDKSQFLPYYKKYWKKLPIISGNEEKGAIPKWRKKSFELPFWAWEQFEQVFTK